MRNHEGLRRAFVPTVVLALIAGGAVALYFLCASSGAVWEREHVPAASPQEASSESAIRPKEAGENVELDQAPRSTSRLADSDGERVVSTEAASIQANAGNGRLYAPRSADDVVRLFRFAPLKVSVERILGSKYLNPGIATLGGSQDEILRSTITRHHDLIRDSNKKRALEQHEILESLHRANALTELSLALASPSEAQDLKARAAKALESMLRKGQIEPGSASTQERRDRLLDALALVEMERSAHKFVPGAAAVLRTDGKVLVATDVQVRATREEKDYGVFLCDTFFHEVVALLLANGITPSDVVTDVLARYEKYSHIK